jgi:ADP-heptose:LPS heptosyltransferase
VRILLVSTTAIGDTVMATPMVRAVRKKYPEAHITMFVHHRRREIFDTNPHVNTVLPYYGKWKRLIRTMWALRRGQFDLAIVLHANDPDIVPLVRWTGAPQRVGWGESKWSHLFTHTIFRTNPPEHFLVHKKRLLESIGIPVDDLHTELFFNRDDDEPYRWHVFPWLEKNLRGGSYVVMHAFGATPAGKWWPLDHFFTVAEYLREKHHQLSVFVGDNESLAQVQKHPRFDPTRHFAAVDCTVRQSAYLIKEAAHTLTTDSGPMHLAFAVKCPALCLFGPTNPAIHGPCFDQDLHRVIQRQPLDALAPQEVIEEWEDWVKG